MAPDRTPMPGPSRHTAPHIAAGLLLVLHALAHARVGMWAQDGGLWILPGPGGVGARMAGTLLWAGALVEFMGAGLGLLGVPLLRRRWPSALLTGSLASLALLLLFPRGTDWLVGMGISGAATGAWAALRVRDAAGRGRSQEGGGAAETSGAGRAARQSGSSGGGTEGVTERPRTILAALAMLGLILLGAVVLLRPVHRNWGTVAGEAELALPWDEDEQWFYWTNHAVHIQAPPDAVWPWLAQIGQDRGGFYSYDGLENLFGLRIRNADRIHPEWQDIAPGDLVRAAPPDWLGGFFERRIPGGTGWRVDAVEPGRALVLRYWGIFALLPQEDGSTRMLIRTFGGDAGTVGSAILFLTFEPIHFLMERRMLLGIRDRAEGR